MQCTFLNAAGAVLFTRDDMESGHWVQEEMNVTATFPWVRGKEIQRGQRIAFRDPATDVIQMFEIRTVTNTEPDHYQQITAEHIAVAELQDEHIDKHEFTNVPPNDALATVLTGTLWSVGTVSVGDPAAQQAIKDDIDDLNLNGNVDLTARPVVYADAMINAGYTTFSDDYTTLYPMVFESQTAGEDYFTVMVTPIEQNGTVHTQQWVNDYVGSLFAAATNLASFKTLDVLGMLIHVLSGQQTSTMNTKAAAAQTLADQWQDLVSGFASSADTSRGSVWDAVSTISENWNVYIVPRVTINASGITGRYLDIMSADGVWRGVRLSAAKNMSDPAVEINDEEVLTALYGYGGNISSSSASGDDTTSELTFEDIVWTLEDGHPAKPSGQKYLEWPEKTAQYGRNGRARFGYYQNGNIKDGEILLQKTWEALKKTAEPKINISGTVTDLYRLGYKDQPLRLHDMAIVEIEDTGEVFQKEIISLDVDLIDPTGSRVGIGDYIPNIIYINRETSDTASGGGGGGGSGNRGMTNLEDEEIKAYTTFFNTGTKVGMIIGTKDGVDYINAPQISLALNEWDSSTRILLKADTIDIQGVVDSLEAYDVMVQNLNAYNVEFTGDLDVLGQRGIYASGGVWADSGEFNSLIIDSSGTSSLAAASCSSIVVAAGGTASLAAASCTSLSVPSDSFTYGGEAVSWQTYAARWLGVSSERYFLYAATSGSTTPTGTQTGRAIVSITNTTLHYLGKAST